MTMIRAFAAAAVVLLAACASVAPEPQSEVEACRRWYAAVDRAVADEGVRDAQQAPVPGFPYLRVDRLHASLKDRATSEAAFQAYADALLELDLRARRHEIRNLRRPLLSPHETYQRTAACGRLLREVDFARPDRRTQLLQRAEVPDDYSAAARALGLYPLTRLIFVQGVRRWEAETTATLASTPPVPAGATLIRHGPPLAPGASRAEVAGILGRARTDPLGRIRLSDAELRRIATTYAPTFEVVVRADYDRFGALRWLRGSKTPRVDAAHGIVYVSAAQARYRRGTADDTLLQLVYTVWFTERPPLEEADPYAGPLDGLVWRVTLAPDGEPLVYDSIHPCGCFHQFFPTPRAAARPAPDALEEWAFVPRTLPRVKEGERPRVRLASATHFIEGVAIESSPDTLVRYAFEDYDELRSLQRMDGGFRSAFAPDGLIKGTERFERVLFWPMGIASAGGMRQAGRQPTAFVGRRHFDDADLLERRFDLDLEGAR